MKRYIISAFIILCACASESKLAKKCASRFPVHEGSVYIPGEMTYDTAYIPSDTVVLQDTVRVECDSAKQVITRYVYRAAQCPPTKLVTGHATDTVRIYVEDRAKVEYLQARVAVLEKQNKSKGEAILWLSAVCLLESLWIFRKPLLALFA